MAGEFVMGATLQLRDLFSRQVQRATQATQMFSGTTQTADRATGRWRDSQGRLNNTLGQFDRAAHNSTRATRGYAQASSGLAGSLGAVKGAILAVVGAAALKASFSWLVKSNADMETYKNTLAVVLKSEEKAVETLAWAQKFAANTPFEIPQIVEATTRMASYGLNAQKTLGIVGDMASVMGKDLMQAVEAVADAQTGELERLKEFGITKKQIEDQAKLMKVTVTNNQGQITDQKAFNAVLFKLMEDRYKGGMAMQSKTFWGMLSNAKDFVGSIGKTLGAPMFDGMKDGLRNLLDWMNFVQENGTVDRWANHVAYVLKQVAAYFGMFKSFAARHINYVIYRARALYTENKPFFDRLRVILGNVFTELQTKGTPVMQWLNVQLPKIINFLFNIAQKVIDVANYIQTNWSWIEPLVQGIALALGVYLTYLGLVKAMTKTAAVMQWLWNAAMTANPIGLIIVVIGLLVGGLILLYRHWDMVKQGASDMWIGILNFFKSGVNQALGLINKLSDGIKKVTGKDFGHVELLQMEQTSVEKRSSFDAVRGIDGKHKNGLSYVPFDGYRSELHKGEAVLTASENRAYRKGGGGNSFGALIGQLVINGTDKDPGQIADEVIDELHKRFTDADDVNGPGMGALLSA